MEVKTKVCTKCGEEKGLFDFVKLDKGKFGVTPRCKKCLNEQKKEYIKVNKEKVLEYARNQSKKYRQENKEKVIESKKRYIENNKEKRREYDKQYKLKHKERIKERNKNYERIKLNSSEIYKLKKNIRSIIYNAFRYKSYTKTSKTAQILGCSFKEFKLHLESKFESWMNWDNYGKYNGELNYGWDIDHIIPNSSATTEEELIRLNHYTNLQPLCSKINRDIKKHFY